MVKYDFFPGGNDHSAECDPSSTAASEVAASSTPPPKRTHADQQCPSATALPDGASPNPVSMEQGESLCQAIEDRGNVPVPLQLEGEIPAHPGEKRAACVPALLQQQQELSYSFDAGDCQWDFGVNSDEGGNLALRELNQVTVAEEESQDNRSRQVNGEMVADSRVSNTFFANQVFGTYQDFESTLEEYKRTNHINTKKKDSAKNRFENPDLLQKFPFLRVHIVCVHFGQPRVRKEGKRPDQLYSATGCTFELYLAFSKKNHHYVVQKFVEAHKGHLATKETFSMHRQNRRLTEAEQKRYVDELCVKMKVPVQKIVEKIFEDTGKVLKTKDIINCRDRRQVQTRESEIEMTIAVLEEAKKRDPGATVKIVICEAEQQEFGPRGKDIIKAIFFQSSKMKDLFKKNGSLILTDGTYNLTNIGYILVPIHVVDKHFHTSLVSWALVSNEQACVLQSALEIFRDVNSTEKLRFVVLDKDFAEIRAIREVFPNTSLVLCRWHCLQAVQRKMVQSMGRRNSELNNEILELFKKMVYAPSEEEYMRAWQSLCSVDSREEGVREMLMYLDQHWHQNRDCFAYYLLKRKGLFQCYSNNRAEGFNSFVKRFIKKRSKCHTLVQELLSMERGQTQRTKWKTYESTQKSFHPREMENSYIEEILSEARGLLSINMLKKVRDEAVKVDEVKIEDLNLEQGALVCTRKTGPCSFFTSMILPCRHIFATRKQNHEILFEKSMVPAQWRLDSGCDIAQEENPVNVGQSSGDLYIRNSKTARKDRFAEIQPLLKELGGLHSELPKERRRLLARQLESLLNATNNDIPCASESGQEHQDNTVQDQQGRPAQDLMFSPHKVNSRLNMRTSGSSRSRRRILAHSELTAEEKATVDWFKSHGATQNWDRDDFLVLSDRNRTGTDAYLFDSHLVYALVLLKIQFPNIGSFQDTYTYRDDQGGFMAVNSSVPFIQPVHSGLSHWSVLTNIGTADSSRDKIVLYDSMTNLSKNSNEKAVIPGAVYTQAAQLLKDKSGRTNITIQILPCQQQRNATDCGLHVIANMSALAFGKNPSEIVYTGDLRREFLEMIMRKKMTMFSHVPKNPGNPEHIFTVRAESGISHQIEMHPMEECFEIVCFCKLPKYWGDVVTCDKCDLDFHQECHMLGITPEKNIADHLTSFLCYTCRVPGDYSFQKKICEVDHQAIENAIHNIDKMSSFTLSKMYETLRQLRRIVPIEMVQYEKLEEITSIYDLNSVCKKQGGLFVAIKNYYLKYYRGLEKSLQFDELSHPQLMFLAVVLVCQSQKLSCPPLWEQDESEKRKSAEEAIQDTKKSIKVLMEDLKQFETKKRDIMTSKFPLREKRDAISSLKSGLQKSFSSLNSVRTIISQQDTDSKKTTSEQKAMIKQIDSLLVSNVTIREQLEEFLSSNTNV